MHTPTLALCLAAAALAWQPAPVAPEPVRIADDFRADSRKEYLSKGDVSWEAGRVTLRPGAVLIRKAALGHAATVRASLTLPPDKAAGAVNLLFVPPPKRAGLPGVALKYRESRAELVGMGKPPPVALLPASAGSGREWEVRVDLRLGVVRARA